MSGVAALPVALPAIEIRSARPADSQKIHALLESFAERGLLLSRTLDQIRSMIDDFVVAVEDDRHLVGCGALRISSDTVAEIAALAVEESRHGQGVGSRVVWALEAGAKELGIHQLFARTLQHGFFHELGFSVTDACELPDRVNWRATKWLTR